MELGGLLGQGALGKGVENVTRLGQHLGNSSQGQAGRAKGTCSSGAPASRVGGDKSCEELTRGRGHVWEKESFPLSLFFDLILRTKYYVKLWHWYQLRGH